MDSIKTRIETYGIFSILDCPEENNVQPHPKFTSIESQSEVKITTMSKDFVHLHNHTEYSLLDGAVRIEDLVKATSDYGMKAVAITDHGAMYGVVDFYRACAEQGIKPVIGCEIYITPESRYKKSTRKDATLYHLTLLSQNNEGYKNLVEIVTKSYLDGYYYKPRVDKELLLKHSKGIIALSGCVSGEIPKLIVQGQEEKAYEALKDYIDIFGKENFFLELQYHRLKEQETIIRSLIKMSKAEKIKLVATNDAHYLKKEDKAAHDVLLCIQTNSKIDEEDRFGFKTDEFYFKSPEEMWALFSDNEEALLNTIEIADRTEVKLEFGNIHLPEYQAPKGHTLDTYLKELCERGLKNRYEVITPEIRERIDHELKIISEMGFAGYFLIVWDVITWAKKQGIRVGPGRGSAAGSLVAYVLGISDIDPIRFNLLFERFLNPSRRTMPDIDIDFAEDRREEVIDYVRRKFGEDRVAQIITFSTMKARAATRDSGRVLGHSYSYVDKIAKLITHDTIEASLAYVKELKEMYEIDTDAKKIIETARKLEGLVRQDSIHAAGVVISKEPLTNLVPLQKKGDSEVVTQFSMKPISDIGLLKMDFLGLRTLTVIENAIQLIKNNRGEKIDFSELCLDDKDTYKLLQKGETIGVFQLERPGMRAMLKELRPTRFEDLIAANALNRPGPLKSGMVQDFINRKHGRQKIEYPHPLLKPVLEDTYGTIVYQEQVMAIASTLAGYSLQEADELRQAISKKTMKKFKTEKDKFIKGAGQRGVDEGAAKNIFDLLIHFLEYAFNKSHSAAYALVAFQTAWLKTHYPVEFFTSLLTSVQDDKDKIALYVNEARRMGIKVLHPDINRSQVGFYPDGEKAIRFGLSTVRNVGENMAEAIINARRAKPYSSIFDFVMRVESAAINKRNVESLIKAGAFNSLGYKRKHLLEIYDLAIEQANKRKVMLNAGQFSLFGGELEATPQEEDVFKPSEEEEYSREVILSFEKEMLGAFITEHPVSSYTEIFKKKCSHTLAELMEAEDGTNVIVGGIIVSVKKSLTKKGDLMANFTIEDLEGQITCLIWPSELEKYNGIVVADRVVLVKGRLDIKEEIQEAKIIVNEIYNPEDPIEITKRTPQKSLHIKVNIEDVKNPDWKVKLKSVLVKHPGKSEVYLHLTSSENLMKTVKLGSEYRVSITPTMFKECQLVLEPEEVYVRNETT